MKQFIRFKMIIELVKESERFSIRQFCKHSYKELQSGFSHKSENMKDNRANRYNIGIVLALLIKTVAVDNDIMI